MRKILLSILLFIPIAVSARNYAPTELPYSDVPSDFSTKVAISVLTEEGIVQGNPDGTFAPSRTLNRAEFLKIVMGLVADTGAEYSQTCFIDVFSTAWYAAPVCRAKKLGIVEGNRVEGVPPENWLFVPERSVQYVEALKILHTALRMEAPITEGAWYQRYIDNAEAKGIHLPEKPVPDHRLSRGDMARLVVRFIASRDGELAFLLAAEQGALVDDGSDTTDDDPVLLDGSGAQLDSGTGAEIEIPEYDSMTDTTVTADFLPLGETSSIIAAATILSEDQPLDITSFVIRMNKVPSVKYFLVYDGNTKFLGRAHLDTVSSGGLNEYRLPVKRSAVTLAKEEPYSFYVRAVIKGDDEGGVSGEFVQVSRLGIEGNGVWNNKSQSEFSSEDFPTFQTARAVITDISNPSAVSNVLISGNQIRLGTFRFAGKKADGASSIDLEITDLSVNLDTTGGATVTNIWLSADGTNERELCTLAGSIITCSNIDPTFGSFEDRPRTITLYGDVQIPSSTNNAHIQLRLNDPGSAATTGAVRWTDGTINFHWVPGEMPLLRSTDYQY